MEAKAMLLVMGALALLLSVLPIRSAHAIGSIGDTPPILAGPGRGTVGPYPTGQTTCNLSMVLKVLGAQAARVNAATRLAAISGGYPIGDFSQATKEGLYIACTSSFSGTTHLYVNPADQTLLHSVLALAGPRLHNQMKPSVGSPNADHRQISFVYDNINGSFTCGVGITCMNVLAVDSFNEVSND